MENKTFCVQPWFGKEYLDNREYVCCWMTSQYDLEEVRSDLLDGKKSSACQRCWNVEAKGEKSRRHQQNEYLDFLLDRDIQYIEEDVRAGKFTPMVYQVSTSNHCNAACVTCNSRDSTTWGKYLSEKQYKTIDADINYETAKSINLMGGEPFLEKKNLQIFDKLLECGNTDCMLTFVTNGSVINREFLSRIEKFPRSNVCFSIDGIDKVFDYMRFPLTFTELKRNMRIIRMYSDVSVNYTDSNVNALYKEQTFEYFDRNNLKYFVTPVQHKYFSGPVTEDTLKQLDFQDKLKGISRKDYIPEFVEKYG